MAEGVVGCSGIAPVAPLTATLQPLTGSAGYSGSARRLRIKLLRALGALRLMPIARSSRERQQLAAAACRGVHNGNAAANPARCLWPACLLRSLLHTSFAAMCFIRLQHTSRITACTIRFQLLLAQSPAMHHPPAMDNTYHTGYYPKLAVAIRSSAAGLHHTFYILYLG